MFGRSVTRLALLASVVGVLLGGGAASGAPPRPPEGPFPPAAFVVEGSNGYLIAVSSFVDPHSGRGFVGLTARRGRESASYEVPAKVTEDSVRADFGQLGRVDLVLHRSGGEATFDPRCIHHQDTYEAGTYEGTFDFDGEGGFTRARTTRVPALPALAVVPRDELCGGRSSGESRGAGLPGARLAGVSYANGRTLKFQFNKNRPGGKALFVASVAERQGGIRIHREVSGTDAPNAFRYAADLRTATLRPPAPFSGNASLRRNRDSVSPSIAGNLKLAFPGRSIRLAGPAVHVSLVHARLEKGEDGSISIGFRRLIQMPGAWSGTG